MVTTTSFDEVVNPDVVSVKKFATKTVVVGDGEDVEASALAEESVFVDSLVVSIVSWLDGAIESVASAVAIRISSVVAVASLALSVAVTPLALSVAVAPLALSVAVPTIGVSVGVSSAVADIEIASVPSREAPGNMAVAAVVVALDAASTVASAILDVTGDIAFAVAVVIVRACVVGSEMKVELV